MMRFLLLLAASVIIALTAILLLPQTGIARANGEIAWTESLYDQKTRIAESINGPRVLVIGGSSALFSFDAELATKRLGMPVVNLATHAGLGLDYLLDRAARLLRPGDTVILVPEYELLTQAGPVSEHAIQIVAFYDHGFLEALPWRDRAQYLLGYNPLPALASGARALIGRPAQGRSDVSLDRSGNVRGNTIAASNAASLRNAAPGTRPLAPERIARLREFSAKAKTQNVKILVIPPALIMTPAYGAARFRHFQDSLNSLYTGLGMLPVGDPVIGFLPPEDMYDSVYHANDRGRARYTQRVLDAICRAAFCQRATR